MRYKIPCSLKNNNNMPPNISINFTCTTSLPSPKFKTRHRTPHHLLHTYHKAQAQAQITPTDNATRKDKWGAYTIKKPYLCQWNTTPTTTKWVERSQLFHIDNLTLEHNLLLLHKFTQNVYTKNTLATYETCINFSQSKDQRFVKC